MQQWEENEQKKEYLKSYRKAQIREQRILDEIQRLRMDKMFPSVTYDDMPHGTDVGDMSDYIVLVEAEIEKLKQERLEKIKLYREIESRIRAMTNDNEQDVLRLRYLTGFSWEQVAVKMGYSWQHVHKIHASALKNFIWR
ncbi:MAG: sigma factor-like helix-turn-helix DNA-binding protein [Lachnospiraceae bacterium]